MNNPGERQPAKRRVYPVLFSDTHGGDAHGLLLPDVVWQDYTRNGERREYAPTPNPIQEFLGMLYLDCIEKSFARARRDEVIPMHGGDFSAGDKHDGPDTMTPSFSGQKAIALSAMLPWFKRKNVKRARFVEGTEAHDFAGMGMVYELASHLRDKFPRIDIQVVQHGLIDIDGFTIDYSHHGPSPGKYIWTKGNVARSYLRDLMIREDFAKRRPPDLVWRAHYHETVIEELRINGYKSTLIVTPSFAFPGAWARQALSSVYDIVNGMIQLEIVGGKLVDIYEYTERTDTRTKEFI